MEITIYRHPYGDGRIEYDFGTLVVSNDLEKTSTVVEIGTDGIRLLGEKLIALSKLLEEDA